MYTSIYLYRVPMAHVNTFLQVQQEVSVLYRQHGALGDITLVARDLEAKYGCQTFGESFTIAEQEVAMVGLSSFRDRVHYDEVMAKVHADEAIRLLYHKMTTLLDVGRIVRGEFERVV